MSVAAMGASARDQTSDARLPLVLVADPIAAEGLAVLESHTRLERAIAATLNGRSVGTRLASMFSIPYVVAAVLVAGHAQPEVFDDQHRRQPEIRRLMQATRVVATEEFAARLPDERGARVTLILDDRSRLIGEVPNPVGDTAYHPFGLPEVRAKLDALLPPGWSVEAFEALVRELVSARDVNPILEQMP